jgi:cellulose synthase/poly-beta-1,6-N-acetylglucosamine synthase-like glycosyltransferase
VFVLDDARSSALESAIDSYNDHRPSEIATEVIYLSRTKPPGRPHNFKSGNLQFGVAESTKIGIRSEFIAALDADAIAEPDWLRRTISHLILDSKLALVNPAQVG